jgi:uncharacterized protein (TIGR03437 family)
MKALISFFIAISCAFAQLPTISPGGIVEAASYSAPVAPGSLVTIFGNNLASSEITARSIPLPAVLGGTSVLVNGMSAPLLYVSPNQINLQFPSSLPFNQAAQVTVVTSVSPSLFTADGSGCGQLAALNVSSDGGVSLNSPANSAAPGDIVSLYGTGMGVPTPRPPMDRHPILPSVSLVR